MNTFDSISEIVGFEGPEKRLEIDFKTNNPQSKGLRSLEREQINELLDLAKCTIVSSKSNEYFDSYVLSESSLFVYPFKLMIKTCGTTTLLSCIPKLIEFANLLDLSIEFVMYSRKNFLFPHKQNSPHSGWSEEVDFLNKIFHGTAYILGPVTQSHWHLYIADYAENREASDNKITLEIMMHDLDRTSALKFYRREDISNDTKFPGIIDLLPGSETDEFNFSPCGYSMNGLFNEFYYTIHVTPESHCSYASFETNATLSSYIKLISSVCEIFKPGSFTVTLFNQSEFLGNDYFRKDYVNLLSGFSMKYKTICEFEGNLNVTLCSFQADCSGGQKRPLPKLLLNDVQES